MIPHIHEFNHAGGRCKMCLLTYAEYTAHHERGEPLPIKVGDTLYRFDRYRTTRSEPVSSYKIVGESRQSWHVGSPANPSKVNKVTMLEAGRSGFCGTKWYTKKGIDDAIWRDKHAREIGTIIQGQPIAVLKKIAALIGYDEEKQGCR